MDNAKVIKLYKQRKGIPYIMEKTGATKEEIETILKDPTSYVPTQEEEKEAFLKNTLLDVNQILDRYEQGQDTGKIASKLRVAESYVKDMIERGKTGAEMYWRKMLNMPEPKPVQEEEVDSINTDAGDVLASEEDPKPEAKKPKREASAKGESREDAIVKVLQDTPEGLTREGIGEAVNKLLGINRHAWGHTIGDVKRSGKITYDKEKKLYYAA